MNLLTDSGQNLRRSRKESASQDRVPRLMAARTEAEEKLRQLVSFDEFCKLYRECSPEVQDPNFESLYCKFRGLPEGKIREFLALPGSDKPEGEGEGEPIPRVKPKEVLSFPLSFFGSCSPFLAVISRYPALAPAVSGECEEAAAIKQRQKHRRSSPAHVLGGHRSGASGPSAESCAPRG